MSLATPETREQFDMADAEIDLGPAPNSKTMDKGGNNGDTTDAKGFPFPGLNRLNKHLPPPTEPGTKTNPLTMPTGRDDTQYNTKLEKMGVALIFNHRDFHKDLNFNSRRGTDLDCLSLQETILHLGFDKDDIHVFENKKAHEVNAEIRKYATMDYSNYCCLLIAVCTHGDKGQLYAQDRTISTDELWEPFAGHKCPTLAGKPKLFFIQACQGDKVDHGIDMDQTDGKAMFKIPSYADFLIMNSTIPGFFSWRNVDKGSWFIESLCKVMKEYGNTHDLLSLLTIVNNYVASNYMSYVPHDKSMDKKKQIPCITSMLTRKLCFRCLPKHV